MPDFQDIRQLAAEARARIIELTPEQARQKIAEGVLVIDVRDDEELLRNPPLAGALHLSRGRLEYLISDAVTDRDTPILIYCAGGNRGVLATDSLRRLGYTNACNLQGGLHAWRIDAGKRWVRSPFADAA